MKICTKCKIEKEFDEFQKRMASPDFLTARCKQCLSEYDKTRAGNPDRVKARKEYSKTEKGKKASSRAKRKWSVNNKDKIYQANKKYSESNIKKRKVHGLVAYAIKMEMLKKQACEICECDKVHAHHDDYDKPLNVRWLCPGHHRDWHTKNGEGRNSY